ncbi:hypothetical protein BZL29_6834 [Mycobacterium kansasii]|uniref:Uncharacterized protein n=1 Tax=Mycobacterium kansasii TaxID=1768 RepID=A0A1V3WN53_MYCKA|nr:hypothetical protein BZL29_6834 [Mycobacterium kansasii]
MRIENHDAQTHRPADEARNGAGTRWTRRRQRARYVGG